jgi:hypothetical protein
MQFRQMRPARFFSASSQLFYPSLIFLSYFSVSLSLFKSHRSFVKRMVFVILFVKNFTKFSL